MMRRCVLAVLGVLVGVCAAQEQRLPVDGGALLNEVWQTTRKEFFDPAMQGVDWDGARLRYLPRAAEAETRAEAGEVINEMLGLLETSHTRYVHEEEVAYYELLDVFNIADSPGRKLVDAIYKDGVVRMASIGVVTEVIEGKTFVKDVLHGSPAERAGILIGDEIVSAGGEAFDPVYSLSGKAGTPIRLEIQRTRDKGSRQEIQVDVELVVPHEAFERDMRESVRVFDRGAARVGYVRVYSFAGEQYYLLLKSLVSSAPLKDADALVIDLRGGWGGAEPEYLHVVSKRVPRLSFRRRDGQWRDVGTGGERADVQPAWTRPSVMLVDGGSRSGKEILAYAFQTYGIGPLVGERTRGAVVGGTIFPLSNGDALYVAVADVRVDGVRLEGVGVGPDVEVQFDRRYAGGVDPQIEKAVEVAAGVAFGGE